MLSGILALAWLISLGLAGFAILRALPLRLRPLEQIAYGFPLGVVGISLLLLAAASFVGTLTNMLLVGGGVLGLGIFVGFSGFFAPGPSRAAPADPAESAVGSTEEDGLPAATDDRSLVAEHDADAVEASASVPDAERSTPKTAPEMTRRSGSTLGLQTTAPTMPVGESMPNVARNVQCWLAYEWTIPLIVAAFLIVRFGTFWAGALEWRDDGLYVGNGGLYADLTFHMADIMSFAYGQNFPPESTLLPGEPVNYHILPAFTTAGLIVLGMEPTAAFSLHSFVFSVFLFFAIFVFAHRIIGRRIAAAVAVLFWVFGGGFGWVPTLGEMERSNDPFEVLRTAPWNFGAQWEHNFVWLNNMMNFVVPQRSWFYGIPLTLLVLTILLQAVRRPTVTPFAVAGVVAAMLPYAHVSGLLTLAMIVPFFAILSFRAWPRPPYEPWVRRHAGLINGWVAFGVVTVALALPQLIVIQGGLGGGVADSFRVQLGWLSANDPWWWFWLKNLGWFLPLLLAALLTRRLFTPWTRRLVWATMPIFAIVNIWVFQPWDWDNLKFLLYWFVIVVAVCAAIMSQLWRRVPTAMMRTTLVLIGVMMLLPGALLNLSQVQDLDRPRIYTAESVDVAEALRVWTPVDSVVASGAMSNNPIMALSGRDIVMSYTGWIWPRGMDAGSRPADLLAIYAWSPNAPELIERWGVDYIVIGPWERENWAPDEAAFAGQFPVFYATDNYVVYAVSPEALAVIGSAPGQQAEDTPVDSAPDIPVTRNTPRPAPREIVRATTEAIEPISTTAAAATPGRANIVAATQTAESATAAATTTDQTGDAVVRRNTPRPAPGRVTPTVTPAATATPTSTPTATAVETPTSTTTATLTTLPSPPVAAATTPASTSPPSPTRTPTPVTTANSTRTPAPTVEPLPKPPIVQTATLSPAVPTSTPVPLPEPPMEEG